MSPKAATILRYLNRNHIVFCYQVFDKLEIEITNSGSLYVDNGSAVGYVVSNDRKFSEDYRKIGMHRMRVLSAQLKQSCQRFIRIDASKQ